MIFDPTRGWSRPLKARPLNGKPLDRRATMPPWHTISFTVESSGALSIVTREDVDPAHALECCYIISTDDRVSVRIRETHLWRRQSRDRLRLRRYSNRTSRRPLCKRRVVGSQKPSIARGSVLQ